MVSEMIVQCFETLNTYGKQPEQLSTITKMFQFALKDYSPDIIKEAFVNYISTGKEMPTPADIVSRVETIFKNRSTSRRYDSMPKPIALPRPTGGKVQWYGKHWEDFTPSDKKALHDHLSALKNREEYIKFLTNHIGYPEAQ